MNLIYRHHFCSNYVQDSPYNGKMDWVLLGFAVITPLSLAFGMAFTRREKALVEIAKFRSFSFQLYM